jgi:formate dehydrogenase subunit delta
LSTDAHHPKPVVRLINDISVQFHRMPVDVAGAAIADHIRQFWDPRMRSQLASLTLAEEDDLDERSLVAANLLRVAAKPAV